jgi:hypothetical protein
VSCANGFSNNEFRLNRMPYRKNRFLSGRHIHRIELRNLECYVPFWALAEVFGCSPMYWHRLERSLGRFSSVGQEFWFHPDFARAAL